MASCQNPEPIPEPTSTASQQNGDGGDQDNNEEEEEEPVTPPVPPQPTEGNGGSSQPGDTPHNDDLRVVLTNSITVNGNTFMLVGHSLVYLNANGDLVFPHSHAYTLSADATATVGGHSYTFKGGTYQTGYSSPYYIISFHSNGAVSNGTLPEGTNTFTIGGYSFRLAFASTTNVYFRTNGELAHIPGAQYHLAANATATVGGNQYTFASNYIYFHSNGVVRGGALAADKTVDVGGNQYTFASNNRISFHSNGVVSSGTLANGREVTFTEAGVLNE